MKLVRRLSQPKSPSQPEKFCCGGKNCPDVWETDAGDFVVIGANVTELTREQLPDGLGIADNERAVRIPRELFVNAKLG